MRCELTLKNGLASGLSLFENDRFRESGKSFGLLQKIGENLVGQIEFLEFDAKVSQILSRSVRASGEISKKIISF